MGYSKLRKGNKDKSRVKEAILYMLDLRMRKYESKDAGSKGYGLYLIQKVLNNNRNKNKYYWEEIAEAVQDLYKNSYISYHKFHFYFITDKGKRLLSIEQDKRGKHISELIKKIF